MEPPPPLRFFTCQIIALATACGLSSCTLGLGTVASGLMNYVSRPLVGQPLDYLPHPDLQQWAARPGPLLEVRMGTPISASLRVTDAELSAASARRAPRPGAGWRGRAGTLVGQISTLLAATDTATRDLFLSNSKEIGILDEVPGEYADKRRQLALNEFPFVLLQGERLDYVRASSGPWPEMALAETHGKVTVITKNGTFFGIAQRISFRRGKGVVLLEGDPTVQSGQQHIKGVKPGTLMLLDYTKGVVMVTGQAEVNKLFR